MEKEQLLTAIHDCLDHIPEVKQRWQIDRQAELDALANDLQRLESLVQDHWPLREDEKKQFNFFVFYDNDRGNTIEPVIDRLKDIIHRIIQAKNPGS